MRKRTHLRARTTGKKRKDTLPRIILAAFLVLSASHFFCRFDVSGQVEAMFTKAWAESTQSAALPGQPAAGTVLPETVKTIKFSSIERNPFMAPEDIAVKKATKPTTANSAPFTSPANKAGGQQAMPAPAAPVAAPTPTLNGIINKGNASMAIISYAGGSGSYRVGQSVGGGYYVSGIGSNYVDLNLDGENTHLTLGR